MLYQLAALSWTDGFGGQSNLSSWYLCGNMEQRSCFMGPRLNAHSLVASLATLHVSRVSLPTYSVPQSSVGGLHIAILARNAGLPIIRQVSFGNIGSGCEASPLESSTNCDYRYVVCKLAWSRTPSWQRPGDRRAGLRETGETFQLKRLRDVKPQLFR